MGWFPAEQYKDMDVKELKKIAEKDSYIALIQFFNGKKNNLEAKIAVGVCANIVREKQADNNEKHLRLVEKKIAQNEKLLGQIPQDAQNN